jgi:hypothetical protein
MIPGLKSDTQNMSNINANAFHSAINKTSVSDDNDDDDDNNNNNTPNSSMVLVM